MPRLTAAQIEAMDMIHEIGDEVCLQMPFEVGDIQFMNQHVTYHGRTSFTDDAAAGAHRVLLRIWLVRPVHPARCRTATRCNGATRAPERCAAERSPAKARCSTKGPRLRRSRRAECGDIRWGSGLSRGRGQVPR